KVDQDSMVELESITKMNGFALYEYALQSYRVSMYGLSVVSFVQFAMFSLYPTKNMTSGEGGMVITATEAIARRLKLLRNQGMERQYEKELVGFNARMTEIHASIDRVQLNKVAEWTATHQANAEY